MPIRRRDFLKAGGLLAASSLIPGCQSAPLFKQSAADPLFRMVQFNDVHLRVMPDLSGDLGPGLAVPMEIVGIAGHVSHWGLDSDATARVRSELYLPLSQIPDQFMKGMAAGSTFVVRTGADPLAMLPAVRGAVLETGNDQPVYGVRTMDQIVSASIADRRFSMLLGIFAGLALLLAAVGIYGVISYTVAQRTREIGIRMALGAGHADVVKVVLAQGMFPVLTGLAIGLAASFGLTRLMAGMLYGVSAGDPVTFIGVALVLAAVALIAILVPARRATRVAPVVALRYE
ncbi:MAG: FtsX-like permease family protein [Acidobacteria bacterium]|nr:FtsX-like permease family protein [Acidobacteriota bacterium]